MPRTARKSRAPTGPSQRQLRAGEVIRHALAGLLRQDALDDPLLQAHPVTLSEVRMSPDLRHALCFVESLGGVEAGGVVEALNRSARFLRGRLGSEIQMRFTPDLRFVRDQSFAAAEHMSRLLDDPRIRADLEATDEAASQSQIASVKPSGGS